MHRSIFASVILVSAIFAAPLPAQSLQSMEFRDQELTDILLVLGQVGGVSIVPDDTVKGRASYYFAQTDFSVAFDAFLSAYKLYVRKEGSIWFVSRVGVRWNAEKRLLSLDAEDVDIQLVLNAAARVMGMTVLYDSLPRDVATVHIKDLAPEKAVEIIMKRFVGYVVEPAADHIYVRKLPVTAGSSSSLGPRGESFSRNSEGLYSIDKDSVRFLDLVEELFRKEGKQFSLLMRGDLQLERLRWRDKTFEQMLALVLEQANADISVRDGMYYLFEIQRKDVVKSLKQSITVQLRYTSATDAVALMPSDLSSGGFYKIDKSTNSVLLTGSQEEIGAIVDFLKAIDRPLEGREFFRFQTTWIKAKDVLALLPTWFSAQGPILMPDGSGFIVALTAEQKEEADRYLGILDRKSDSYPVRLRYITSSDLLKTLPPSVAKEDLVETGNPSVIFFIGGEDKRERFLKELDILDRPKPQIRYDILVLQFERSDTRDWTRSISFDPTTPDVGYSLSGTLGELLSMNFDVVSELGYLFAATLSLKIEQMDVRVFADTTLTGLSGSDIKFQNTNTFRYNIEIDPDDGSTKATVVTRELASGLIFSLNGWVSGDGMITMDISATISKQTGGTDSSSGDSPPTTSERLVSSRVRTSSGEPVTLSGLIQRERTETIKKIPILGDIPLLGYLFRNVNHEEHDTELVVYIVPRVLPSGASANGDSSAGNVGLEMERLYQELVEGLLP